MAQSKSTKSTEIPQLEFDSEEVFEKVQSIINASRTNDEFTTTNKRFKDYITKHALDPKPFIVDSENSHGRFESKRTFNIQLYKFSNPNEQPFTSASVAIQKTLQTLESSDSFIEVWKTIYEVESYLFAIGWRLMMHTSVHDVHVSELVKTPGTLMRSVSKINAKNVNNSTSMLRGNTSKTPLMRFLSMPVNSSEVLSFQIPSVYVPGLPEAKPASNQSGGFLNLFKFLRCCFGICPIGNQTPTIIYEPLPKLKNMNFDYGKKLVSSEAEAMEILNNLREIWVPYDPQVQVDILKNNEVRFLDILETIKSLIKTTTFKYKSFNCENDAPCVLFECEFTQESGQPQTIQVYVTEGETGKARFILHKDNTLTDLDQFINELKQKPDVIIQVIHLKPIYRGNSKKMNDLEKIIGDHKKQKNANIRKDGITEIEEVPNDKSLEMMGPIDFTIDAFVKYVTDDCVRNRVEATTTQ